MFGKSLEIVLHFKGWNKTWNNSYVVSSEQELISAMNYDKRRPMGLHLSNCSKDLVEEKDNNEVEIVAHNTVEPVNENIDATIDVYANVNANAYDSDSNNDDDSGVEDESTLRGG